MKSFQSIWLLLVVVSVSGCIPFAGNQKTIVTKSLDPNTLIETTTTVTEDVDFWESSNLKNYFDFEKQRSADHKENVAKKIDAIQENAAKAFTTLNTPVEQALFQIVVQQQLAAIPTTPGPSGVQAPRTAVDLWERNLIPAAGLTLSLASNLFDLGWDFGSYGGSSSGTTAKLDGVTVGGDLLIASEQDGTYNLQDEAGLAFTNTPTFTWTDKYGSEISLGENAASSYNQSDERGVIK